MKIGEKSKDAETIQKIALAFLSQGDAVYQCGRHLPAAVKPSFFVRSIGTRMGRNALRFVPQGA